jgi:hypothetical protein
MTVPTSPGAGQIAAARAYLERVTAALPSRRAMSREYLTLLGHAAALLSAIDMGAPARPTSPETAARRRLAESVEADFTREAAEFAGGGKVPDWLAWSHRLARALGGLLDALNAEPPPGGLEAFRAAAIASSGRAPDGSGRLSPDDLLTTIAALFDAAEYRSNHPDDGDRRLIAAYRSLAHSLGDDR